jgi:predicted outer membrane protein
MKIMRNHVLAALAALVAVACGVEDDREVTTTTSLTKAGDPIAYVGHGALFRADGTELTPDVPLVFATQAQYRRTLEAQVDAALAARARAAVEEFASASDDERAALDAQLVRVLGALVGTPEAWDTIGKSATLHDAYRALRPAAAVSYPAIEARMRTIGLVAPPADATLASTYEQDCLAAGVPVPPAWGGAGWTDNGLLKNPFIVADKLALVFYWSSESPRGTCIALPRWKEGGTISPLGIICHGVDTSKACFWDKASVDWGAQVPIAQFTQGNTPDIAAGGKCTDCHAGENPFIIHPNTALDLKNVVPASRWATKNWYDPLIHANLAQNPGPTNAIASMPVTQEPSCRSCHTAQRLPELSQGNGSFCDYVFRTAVGKKEPKIPRTMPPAPAIPSMIFAMQTAALDARCSTPVSALCAPDNAKICAQAGGYCEIAKNATSRHDLCRWPDAKTSVACAQTAAFELTSKGSVFATTWPTAVPALDASACITQMANIGGRPSTESACSAANRDRCRARGGFCENAINQAKTSTHQLCRWPNHDTQTKCSATAGAWTPKGSAFDLVWPSALRGNQLGACITQMANIGGTPN